MEIQNKIDAYLMGGMSDAESLQFESEMAQNPDLKSEVSLQQGIISALQESRHSELKSRLNSLNVSATNTFNIKPWLIGASVVVGTSVAGLLLWNANSTENIPTQHLEQTQNQILDHKVDEVIETTNETIVSEPETFVTQNTNIETVVKEKVEHTSLSTPATNEVVASPAIPTIPTEIDDNSHEDITHSSGDHHEHNNIVSQDDLEINSSLVPIVEHKKNMFHYQYDGESLKLIGNFSGDTYTVYDLQEGKDSPLYLKFENRFYTIKNSQGKTEKLVEVVDKGILSELKTK
ncbi:MAG: hypothetical protein GY827_01245 [Cytophagales bacterium]|nr:hypothetical protein [Cytophagales bacterium]